MTTRDDIPQDPDRELERELEEQRLQALRDDLHQRVLQILPQHFKKWLYTLDKRSLWKIREDGFITVKFALGPGRKPDISPGKLLYLRDEYRHLKVVLEDYVKDYCRGALKWDRKCKTRKDFVEKIVTVVQVLHQLGKRFRVLDQYDEDAKDPQTGKVYVRRKPLEQEIALKIAQRAVGRGKRPRNAKKDAILHGLLAHYHNTRPDTIRGRLRAIKRLRRGIYSVSLYE